MKVLLDTNILASAAATRGLCTDVLREVLAEHDLLLCPQILTELRRILRDKFGVSETIINEFVWLVQQDTLMTKPKKLPAEDIEDQDDLGILAAAINGGADVIVTGDKELQDLNECSGIPILSPREFWEKLTA